MGSTLIELNDILYGNIEVIHPNEKATKNILKQIRKYYGENALLYMGADTQNWLIMRDDGILYMGESNDELSDYYVYMTVEKKKKKENSYV